jgi:hypothetical protein
MEAPRFGRGGGGNTVRHRQRTGRWAAWNLAHLTYGLFEQTVLSPSLTPERIGLQRAFSNRMEPATRRARFNLLLFLERLSLGAFFLERLSLGAFFGPSFRQAEPRTAWRPFEDAPSSRPFFQRSRFQCSPFQRSQLQRSARSSAVRCNAGPSESRVSEAGIAPGRRLRPPSKASDSSGGAYLVGCAVSDGLPRIGSPSLVLVLGRPLPRSRKRATRLVPRLH